MNRQKSESHQLKAWIRTMKMTVARLLFLTVSLLTGIRTLQAGVEQGWDYYKEHDYQRASGEFEKAISAGHSEAATHEGLGWCYYWLGRYDSAEEEFTKALSIDPALGGAIKGITEVKKWRYLQFNRAWQLFNNQDYTTALALFQQILNDQTNRLPAGEIWKVHSGMGWCHYYLNNFVEAEKSFRNILSIYKGNEHALKGLGFTLYRLGKSDDAEKILKEALEKHPEWSDTYSILGWTYYNQQKFQEAQKTFEQALSVDPSYSDALYGLAWTVHWLNDDTIAHNLFIRAAEASPFHPSVYDIFTLIDKTRSWWDLYEQFGWSYYKNADYTSAEKTFNAGLKRLHNDPNLRRGLAFCLFRESDYPAVLELLKNIDEVAAKLEPVVETGMASDGTEYTIRSNSASIMAWCKFYGGAYKEATNLFRANLETHGDWTDLHSGLGWCAIKMGDFDTAQTYLDNALKLNPSYKTALLGKQEIHNIRYSDFNSAWNSFYSENYIEAEKKFRTILDSDLSSIDAEDQWQIYSGLGSSLLNLHNAEEAAKVYSRCLELNKDNPYCLSGKARALMQLDRFDDAEKLVKKLLKQDSANAAYETLMGRVYYEQGHLTQAMNSFNNAINLNAGEVSAHAMLGLINLVRKNLETAEECFQTALSIDPDNAEAKTGMDMLETMKNK